MDDLAKASGLTQEDRAARARLAWELYRDAYRGSEICDLMADLAHLAEVEDDDWGGGEAALSSALTNFIAESPDPDDDDEDANRPCGCGGTGTHGVDHDD